MSDVIQKRIANYIDANRVRENLAQYMMSAKTAMVRDGITDAERKSLEKYIGCLENLLSVLPNSGREGFRWTCSSDDGAYTDESKTVFDCQEDCYTDMMRAATIKMRWNIEWDDVTSDTPISKTADGIVKSEYSIGWELHAFSDRIVISSSAKYTYKIEVVK